MSGIFGIVSSNNCTEALYHGTALHIHMGGRTHAGLAVLNKRGNIVPANHSIAGSQYVNEFTRHLKDSNFFGTSGIGVISDFDVQPILVKTTSGTNAIVFNGRISNLDELVGQMIRQGESFNIISQDPETGEEKVNSLELLGKIMAKSKTIEDGIQRIWNTIQGSASILILTKDGVIAARDKYGRTPLTIAYNKITNSWAVASEDCAFINIRYKVHKYLKPGEIVLINSEGVQQICNGDDDLCKICTFLWIYSSFPASFVDGIEVAEARLRCGRCLAKRAQVDGYNLVSGVPSSGILHGFGFSQESGIPYLPILTKYTAIGLDRSFAGLNQKERVEIADFKLLPLTSLINEARIVLTEDSIVRATQLMPWMLRLFDEFNAEKIHIAPGCPPLLYPCEYLRSTRNISELAARRAIMEIEGKSIEDIAAYLDPKSSQFQQMVELIKLRLTGNKTNLAEKVNLKYQFLNDMVEAINLPEEKLCLYCWTGEAFPRLSA